MKPAPAIVVETLSKCFRQYPSAWAQLVDTAFPRSGKHYLDSPVLDDVSFTVARGECVGIIGRNGAGKSTLLKIVSGALHPTSGRVAIAGRVLGLLELGTGFNPEMTGRQNVVLASRMHGLPDGYAAANMQRIEAFADIGSFFDRPVKTYSSGMFVRLAFAMFLFMDPDVFIVDEALSVGDLFFQQKCFDAIAGMKARGTTFLVVSHDMTAIRNLCDRTIVLEGGRVSFDGDPGEAVMRYYLANQPVTTGTSTATGVAKSSADPAIVSMRGRNILSGERRMGAKALEILAVRCLDDREHDRLQFRVNEQMTIEILVKANAHIVEPNVGFEFYDKFNMLVYGVSLLNLSMRLPTLEPDEWRIVRFKTRMSAMPGSYALSIATAEQSGTVDPNAGSFLDRHEKLGPVEVIWDRTLLPFYGIANLPTTCEVLSTND